MTSIKDLDNFCRMFNRHLNLNYRTHKLQGFYPEYGYKNKLEFEVKNETLTSYKD